ncbi:MAG TPA: ATPase domain-containing protein [Thermoanaerobaculia bacterium]|nr:ATPase domain-containing protein [Thermoanaerobaculia bacterium]
MHEQEEPAGERAGTGIAGLDDVLGGGFPRNRIYLVEGPSGAGKTTLAIQFLLEGTRHGEPGVYATLSETEDELREVARSHGWSLDGITIVDLQTSEESLKADSHYTLFHPAEIELSETTRTVLEAVERVRPTRVVFESLSEMRLLARDSLRYRRQVLALKHYFAAHRCTVLLLDCESSAGGDLQLQSLTHGILRLEQLALDYGGQRRRLRVQKVRGIPFREGYHDFRIVRGGLRVYPRLVAAEHHGSLPHEAVASGLPELDELLGGGPVRGTSTMLLGPSGVGKSSLATRYVLSAAERGERSSIFTFDELPATWLARASGLGMPVERYLDEGLVELRQIDPAEMPPGEFAVAAREAVERGSRLLVIDSLNGYLNAMPAEHHLTLHLHELLAYLAQQGVLTLLIMGQHGLIGQDVGSPIELSYLSDTVILLRYFEAFGEVRQALAVVKKRTGGHERTVREFRLGPSGLRVGRRLREFQGTLAGQLVYTGERSPLDEADGGSAT